MSIQLDVKKINFVLDVVKTVNDKSARLIIQPLYEAQMLNFICITQGYAVMTTYEGAEGLEEENFPVVFNVDLKAFADLISLAQTNAEISMSGIKNEEGEAYYELNVVIKNPDGLEVDHTLPAYNEAANKRSELTRINFDLLGKLTYENATEGEEGVMSLPRLATIDSITKCILTDNTQIILSAQAQAFTTCGSNYAVVVPDTNLGITATLQVNFARSLCTAFKNVNADNLLIIIDSDQMFISDDQNQIYIQMSLPTAKKTLVGQINGFNTADYSEHSCLIIRKTLLNAIKSFRTLYPSELLTVSIINDTIVFNNTITTHMKPLDEENDKPLSFKIHPELLTRMLSSLSSSVIHLSTTIGVASDQHDEANADEQTALLMRLAETDETGTLGARLFTVL